MRVKNHQKRANVVFTKPLTTHLMRGKGDFLCRVLARGRGSMDRAQRGPYKNDRGPIFPSTARAS